MPRLPRIRLRALDELARQLRFAPRRAAARHASAIVALAGEIDPDRAYAEDWIVRRITGFQSEIDQPAMLVGRALLADLSAFAEHLSAQAGLKNADFQGSCLTLSALQQRWNLSARTIERYRRLGLIAFRAAHGAGVLLFPLSSIERFEAMHRERLTTAQQYRRVTSSQREDLVTKARSLPASNHSSREALARAAAREAGVSPASARRIIRSAAPELAPLRVHADHYERDLALGLWGSGAGPTRIARQLGITRSGVHHLLNAARADRLRSLRLDVSPAFREQAESDLTDALAPPAVREGLGAPGDTDAATLAAASRTRVAPDPARERALAVAFHTLRARAARAIAALSSRPAAAVLDRIEADLRWAALLKIELLRNERPLIVRTIEERAAAPLLELSAHDARTWISAAFRAAADGVERFDPTKRGRLAAPISLALARELADLRPNPSPAGRARPASIAIDDWASHVWRAIEWLALPEAASVALRSGRADPAARVIIERRFGLHVGPPLTLQELDQHHSVRPIDLQRSLSTLCRGDTNG